MKKTQSNKSGRNLFTLAIALLLLMILGACGNTNNKTDETSEKKSEANKTINKDNKFAQLENDFDAKLGVYALDTENNQTIAYQSNERFAYSSTFKPLAAATLLKQNKQADLKKTVTYTNDDLVTYSPVTEKHVDNGMTLLEISEAAIRKSDNTAGNLLLKGIGGPDKFKKALRNIGDDVTLPKRYETELNEFSPKSKRDTSTPKTMVTDLKKVALNDFLPKDKRDLLLDWMSDNETGDPLIRAGAPENWKVADKSGAGTYGTRNDLAVVWPPNKKPIVIAIMSHRDTEKAEYDDALIEKASRIALNALK